MNDLVKSFAVLVKFNNGKFRSDKQANYLLSQCEDSVFYTSYSVWNIPVTLAYECDKLGVVRVVKETPREKKVTWTRDLTDNWMIVHKRQELAAWINRASRTVARSEELVLRKVNNDVKKGVGNSKAIYSMVNKLKSLKQQVHEAHLELQQLQHQQ